MPDINDAAHHFNQYPNTDQEWSLDEHLVQIKHDKNYQQVCLFFATEIQTKLAQSKNLAQILHLNNQLDSRFSLIYHDQYQFGLQAFLSQVIIQSENPKNHKNPIQTIQAIKPSKTSFSAQAKHLFLEMENHSPQQHSEPQSKLAQKPFSELQYAEFQQPSSPYETPCFNILEEMLFQIDFIAAHL
jgi:uncharacterized protein YegP (UPF0339 family)